MKRLRRTVSGLPPAKFRQRLVAKAAGDAVRLPRRTPDAAIRSRFVALRVYPANRTIPRDEIGVLPQAWLIAEQRIGTAEPTDFWLANLPPRTPLSELVRLAEMRRHVDHDRRGLKTALGLTTSRDAHISSGTFTPPWPALRTCSSRCCGRPTRKQPAGPTPTPSCTNCNAHSTVGSVPARAASLLPDLTKSYRRTPGGTGSDRRGDLDSIRSVRVTSRSITTSGRALQKDQRPGPDAIPPNCPAPTPRVRMTATA